MIRVVSYLHHPLGADASRTHIPRSLAMLLEIHRTGDIFFPKRWMDATLSGHSSASAARMVRTFKAELPPNYPDRLRRTVLSSAETTVSRVALDSLLLFTRAATPHVDHADDADKNC